MTLSVAERRRRLYTAERERLRLLEEYHALQVASRMLGHDKVGYPPLEARAVLRTADLTCAMRLTRVNRRLDALRRSLEPHGRARLVR